MDRRFIIFAILVMVLFIVNQVVIAIFFPQPPEPPKVAEQPAKAEKAKPAKSPPARDKEKAQPAEEQPAAEKPAAEKPAGENAGAAAAVEPAPAPPRWIALGSADPNDPWRMLVTANSRGAAIERVELSSPMYCDLEDRRGYLGNLAPTDAPGNAGARVNVVGAGTPASAAGLQADDVIKAVGDYKIATAEDLVEALEESRPGQSLQVSIERDGQAKQLSIELRRHPLAIIRPELDSKPVELLRRGNHDPLSFLLTIQQFDERTLGGRSAELDGVHLHDVDWEIAAADQESVTFKTRALGLEIQKTYRLTRVPAEEISNTNFPAYHLTLEVSIANLTDRPHQVAYRLDGPNGLPIEGAWYANKVSRTWSGAGLRDVITRFESGRPEQVTPMQLAAEDFATHWAKSALDYIAVDAQYFAAAVLPSGDGGVGVYFEDVRPARAGAVPKEKANYRLMNVSFSLDSAPIELAPGDAPLQQSFQVFAGPKRPALLQQYGPQQASLNELLYYGWFGWVARPLLSVLHFFHAIIGNYGLAIIMLTVMVRGLMFPLSRKQAASTKKMQELQPEIKRIAEKFKNDPQKRTQAQQDLFRQHNYNPMGGCLLGFIQAPVFIGLYRSLAVDVELRQAALFGEGIHWASNLAAPDMFWNWSAIMPDFITHGTGIFALGPYLNVFPLLTIGLYLWQQKALMPPPTDEQSAMQQKMMQYMMIFMGILFFRVASGLCLYLIASSLWSTIERRFLPKAAPQGGSPAASSIVSPGTGGNGSMTTKKRQRGRR